MVLREELDWHEVRVVVLLVLLYEHLVLHYQAELVAQPHMRSIEYIQFLVVLIDVWYKMDRQQEIDSAVIATVVVVAVPMAEVVGVLVVAEVVGEFVVAMDAVQKGVEVQAMQHWQRVEVAWVHRLEIDVAKLGIGLVVQAVV